MRAKNETANTRLGLLSSSRITLPQVFLFNLIMAAVIFVPFIIKDGGTLFMVADWNRQQIPFNTYANHAIKTGQTAWSQASDLGTSFVGAFSFYNLGSPFFWLSLIFPPAAFRYLIGPLFMIKLATAGVTSYAFIRRFTKTDMAAFAGGLLYAWSGFQLTNFQFNHFHDVTAFFPLMLIALEQLVVEKKRGRFALAVALGAMINYFFFIGQVLFVVIYFIGRFGFNRSIGKSERRRAFLHCLLEGVLGVGLACFILLPSVLFVAGNPRSELLILEQELMNLFVYRDPRRYLMLIRAFLFPPDPMSAQSAVYNANYQSVAVWLPLVGIVPLGAYLIRKKDWLAKLLWFFGLMAFIPVLNSMFLAFNSAYYARWFYMPILLASLASVRTLEELPRVDQPARQRRALRIIVIPALLTLTFIILTLIASYPEGSPLTHRWPEWIFNISLALISLGVMYLLIANLSGRALLRYLSLAIVPIVILNSWFNVGRMQMLYSYDRPQPTKDLIYDAGPKIAAELPGEDSLDRIYHSSVNWNLSFQLDRPTASSFLSTVSGQIWTFYDSLDISRFVYTELPLEEGEPLRDFLSVRYRIEEYELPDYDLLFVIPTESGTIYVHEVPQDRYIPMGFAMNQWVDRDDFMELPKEERMQALTTAIVLSEEEVGEMEEHSFNQLLTEVDVSELTITLEQQRDNAQVLRNSAPQSLIREKNGWTAQYTREEPGLAYYTVPADPGWGAEVNGDEVPIVEANGFMLVEIPAGDSELRFSYEVPGQTTGIIISAISLLGIVGWTIFAKRTKADDPKP